MMMMMMLTTPIMLQCIIFIQSKTYGFDHGTLAVWVAQHKQNHSSKLEFHRRARPCCPGWSWVSWVNSSILKPPTTPWRFSSFVKVTWLLYLMSNVKWVVICLGNLPIHNYQSCPHFPVLVMLRSFPISQDIQRSWTKLQDKNKGDPPRRDSFPFHFKLKSSKNL